MCSRLGADRRDGPALGAAQSDAVERKRVSAEARSNPPFEWGKTDRPGTRYHDVAGGTRESNAVDALWRQYEELAALNDLYEAVWDIAHAVAGQSAREEVEQTVCERLADVESYLFAWIGGVDAASQTVALRAEAGVEGYLDGIAISVDASDKRSEGPTGRALRTGEIQTLSDADAESGEDLACQHLESRGVHSMAAIPIGHEGAAYGVLNVYAERPRAFEEPARTVLARLGSVVGHAVASLARKRALASDELVEIEFRIPDVFAPLGLPATEGRITLTRAVCVKDGAFLMHGTASGDALDAVEALVERHPAWEELAVPDRAGDGAFHVRVTQPPALSAVLAHGGYVDRVVIEGADYRMQVAFPPEVDVRTFLETVEDAFPGTEMAHIRHVRRDGDTSARFRDALTDELTDRQRAALEASYHSGFFEWPRDRTAEEVAESLDISAPTFHQHLRAAEAKLFEALLSGSAST